MVRRMTAHDSAEAAFICIASGGERPEDRCEGETTEDCLMNMRLEASYPHAQHGSMGCREEHGKNGQAAFEIA